VVIVRPCKWVLFDEKGSGGAGPSGTVEMSGPPRVVASNGTGARAGNRNGNGSSSSNGASDPYKV